MSDNLWKALGLRRATSADFGVGNDSEAQPSFVALDFASDAFACESFDESSHAFEASQTSSEDVFNDPFSPGVDEESARNGLAGEQFAPSERLSREAREGRGQDPVERLVTTILRCAIRDGAQHVIVEALPGTVQVRFVAPATRGEREHLRLPSLTFAPIARLLSQMVRADARKMSHAPADSFVLSVDQLQFRFHLHIESSARNERIELRIESLI